MITISLFYCCEKVFVFMNILMIGKNVLKHHYLKKDKFYSHLNMGHITEADFAPAKRVCKYFEIKEFRRISLFVCSNQYIIVS